MSTCTTTRGIPAWLSRTTTWCSGTSRKTRKSRSSRMARAMATRRAFLQAGGLALAGFALPCVARAGVVDVHTKSDAQGAEVWFDPIGLLIAPGQTVRRVGAANVHTTTAPRPTNAVHSLRIPEGARPWG